MITSTIRSSKSKRCHLSCETPVIVTCNGKPVEVKEQGNGIISFLMKKKYGIPNQGTTLSQQGN